VTPLFCTAARTAPSVGRPATRRLATNARIAADSSGVARGTTVPGAFRARRLAGARRI
jgi:hypothetical protein